jgi:hypothetical protein
MNIIGSPQSCPGKCCRVDVDVAGHAWRGVQRGGGAGITELPLLLKHQGHSSQDPVVVVKFSSCN